MSNLREAGYIIIAMTTFLAWGPVYPSADAPDQEADEDTATMAYEDELVMETVLVTGTRIPRANEVSMSPVAQINADEFLYRGITRVEDMLNALPMVAPTQMSGISNGATGTATVDLRGLTAERTLTLLNGRRLPAGSPVEGGTGVDINQIPAMLIERVEVLTGGASATYGSDAIAGVVNFITLRDFEGVKFDYQYSFYQHKNDSYIADIVSEAGFELPDENVRDGDTHDFSLMMGVNSGNGRGNITLYAGYRDIEALTQSERDYSACALRGSGPDFWCGGSSTIPEGRFTDFGLLWGVGPGSFDYLVEPGTDQFVDRAGHPKAWYNYGPGNYYQRPDKRITLGAFGHYEFNEHFEVYMEVMYMQDRTVAQIAPSGAFFVTDSLHCSNPFLSDQQFQLLCADFGLTKDDTQLVFIGRRNVEGGLRSDNLRHMSNRVVVGVRGDINDNWSYDAFMNFGRVDHSSVYRNDMSISRITRALDVVAHPDTGEAVCTSVLTGADPDCVPWNIFESGAVTQEMVDYLQVPLFANGDTKQKQLQFYVTGDLEEYGWVIPSAYSGVAVALGYEFRSESLNYDPDQNYQSGDAAGHIAPTGPVSGNYEVSEVFFEANIPVIQDKTGAEMIAFDLGYRWSDYSTDNTTNTWKIAGEWMVNEQIRFRGSFQHAVRTANIHELFTPRSISGGGDGDPCVGPNPLAPFTQCANTGVTEAQYGTIPGEGFYDVFCCSNPLLEPEKSDTWAVGLLFNPSFAPGFSLSLDYWDIEITDAIDIIDPDYSLEQCVISGEPILCDKIHRDPQTGMLWRGGAYIDATLTNIGFIHTAGLDILADYVWQFDSAGALRFSLIATWLDIWETEAAPGAPVIECGGDYGGGCGDPRPEWVNNLSTTWVTPWNASVNLTWRYIGAVEDLWEEQNDFQSMNYFDLAVIWDASDYLSFRLGVNNLFDEDPPLGYVGFPGGNGNTYPGRYDALGRYVFIGIQASY